MIKVNLFIHQFDFHIHQCIYKYVNPNDIVLQKYLFLSSFYSISTNETKELFQLYFYQLELSTSFFPSALSLPPLDLSTTPLTNENVTSIVPFLLDFALGIRGVYCGSLSFLGLLVENCCLSTHIDSFSKAYSLLGSL